MVKEYGGPKPCEMPLRLFSNIESGLTLGDTKIDPDEKQFLSDLGKRVKELSALPEMEEKRQLWYDLNSLKPTRAVVFCDPEYGWNQIFTQDQIQCRNSLARRWEMNLRMDIFWGEEMGDDKPVEPFFDVPYTVDPDDWGLQVIYTQTGTLGSYTWENPIKDYKEDFPKLKIPEVNIDWETTNACVELAKEIFSGSLDVRLKGVWWWSMGLTWLAVLFRGMENFYMDFYDCPEDLKRLLAFISEAKMKRLDYLEKNSLLSQNNDDTYICSGGLGYCHELHIDSGRRDGVRCSDMWGFAESQETVSLSPEMYEEFIFPHEKPLLDRFGLNGYGCCEPLHSRWHVVKKHSNLRRVSCSPWVDLEQMADNLEDKYIFSRKPNPNQISTSTIDKDAIRKNIREELEIIRGCRVEYIMKDNHTIGGNPQNVIDWTRIMKEESIRAFERS